MQKEINVTYDGGESRTTGKPVSFMMAKDGDVEIYVEREINYEPDKCEAEESEYFKLQDDFLKKAQQAGYKSEQFCFDWE
jgi:hypothetical protein